MTTFSSGLTVGLSGSRVRWYAESVAVTLTAVAVLVVLGKGIGALGQALALPNACWQLLALRAAAVALVAGTLVRSGRDLWWLFGLGYAAALMLSHTSLPLFTATVLAGVVAAGLRWAGSRQGRLTAWAVWAVPLAFLAVMSGASLYRKLGTQGVVTGGGEWLFDLGIRMSGAVAMLVGVAWVWGWLAGRWAENRGAPLK